MGSAKRRTCVIIPVYNEASVVRVVEGVLTAFSNVIVVDEGSSDGSAEIVASTARHCVRHPFNLGQGAALQTGIRARAGVLVERG